jgi:small subunit ribosomal protein YMR-31
MLRKCEASHKSQTSLFTNYKLLDGTQSELKRGETACFRKRIDTCRSAKLDPRRHSLRASSSSSSSHHIRPSISFCLRLLLYHLRCSKSGSDRRTLVTNHLTSYHFPCCQNETNTHPPAIQTHDQIPREAQFPQRLMSLLLHQSSPHSHFPEADHTPRPHPASPTHDLPSSFSTYRQEATSHGPLKSGNKSSSSSSSSSSSGAQPTAYRKQLLSGKSGRSLGSVQPKEGEYFDRDELPTRFRRTVMSAAEIEAVESAGASFW